MHVSIGNHALKPAERDFFENSLWIQVIISAVRYKQHFILHYAECVFQLSIL